MATYHLAEVPTAPTAPPPTIVSAISPPSGGDWVLIGTQAVTVVPNGYPGGGIDYSVHQMTPYGNMPLIISWIATFIATARSQGKIVFYVGIWGSAELNQYAVVLYTDR